MSNKYKLGIIAYGSLIDDPGIELEEFIINKIGCTTPFNIEYGRTSKTRDYAPTLIPVDNGGAAVSATLLILSEEVNIEDVMSMLWRRETRKLSGKYKAKSNPGKNEVIVNRVKDFEGVENVLYTKIGPNIEGNLSGKLLAETAISSISLNAGTFKRDGVRYLAQAVENGIITPLTEDYIQNVLSQTHTLSLGEAINKLDNQRIHNRFDRYLAPLALTHNDIAAEIDSENDFKKKLEIYAHYYGLIKSNGRIYTKDNDGQELTKIFCNCGNCKKSDDWSNEKKQIYETFIKPEINELQNLIKSDLPYLWKLEIWNAIVDGKATLSFNLSDSQYQISQNPKNAEETRADNEFYYNKIISNWYLKRSSMPKYFDQDFETRRRNYISEYGRAMYKHELKKLTVDAIRSNKNKLRNKESEDYFTNLVYGKVTDLSMKVFEYQDLFYLVVANEDYKFLKFVEEYTGEGKKGFSEFPSEHHNLPINEKLSLNNREEMQRESSETKKIKVFVTYAWGDEKDNERVRSFTNQLRKEGFNAFNDSYIMQNSSSADLQAMMLKNIMESDKVIILLSEKYAEKADKLEGGVGVEYLLILKDIEFNPHKYILTSFQQYNIRLFPLAFRKRELISLVDEQSMVKLHHKLMDTLTYEFSEVSDQLPLLQVKKIPDFKFKKKHKVDVTMKAEFDDDTPNVWDIPSTEIEYTNAVQSNEPEKVKDIIKGNSFLLYDIYERRQGALPIFHDLPIGNHVVDFIWLNDSSTGPEWILVKLSTPNLEVVNANGEVNVELLKEIEIVKSWDNYFQLHPGEKSRIFGAVANFKFKIITGSGNQWQTEEALKWRIQFNKSGNIEIRSYNTFDKSITEISHNPKAFFKFNQFHSTSPSKLIKHHWENYGYMDLWRRNL